MVLEEVFSKKGKIAEDAILQQVFVYNRGSSPSHVTDKITDSKKTYHVGPICLLNKTHGDRTDERVNLHLTLQQ